MNESFVPSLLTSAARDVVQAKSTRLAAFCKGCSTEAVVEVTSLIVATDVNVYSRPFCADVDSRLRSDASESKNESKETLAELIANVAFAFGAESVTTHCVTLLDKSNSILMPLHIWRGQSCVPEKTPPRALIGIHAWYANPWSSLSVLVLFKKNPEPTLSFQQRLFPILRYCAAHRLNWVIRLISTPVREVTVIESIKLRALPIPNEYFALLESV